MEAAEVKGRFLRRWVLAVTVGETLGFAVPAVVGIALAQAGAPGPVLYAAAIAAGVGEGILFGLGQWIGFGSDPPVPRGPWIAATAAGAGLAWSVGGLLFVLDVDWRSAPVLAVAGLGAVVLLASIPTLQWFVLRATVARCAWWIPANMGAWMGALLWTFAPSPLVDERTPVAVLVGSYAVAGLLMALTVALLSGLAAWRLMRRAGHGL